MKEVISFLNWQEIVKDSDKVDSIGGDFFLVDNPFLPLTSSTYPFKVDVICCVICTKGEMSGKINLLPFKAEAPFMLIMMMDQIFEYEYVSEDFAGKFIVMSKQFVGSLNIEEKYSSFIAVKDKPCISLKSTELEAMLGYFNMIQRTIQSTDDNRVCLEIAKCLTKAFFYGAGYKIHKLSENTSKTKEETFMNDFLSLVRANYKEHRTLEFYAEKLSLTPKYMSTLIKDYSGFTAGEWIDNHIVLEAKVRLKNTYMTIQQISDELGFPSQSFFGKFFKRLVGVSPKGYREN